jgi:polar amino acid transport system substrate-binding protein
MKGKTVHLVLSVIALACALAVSTANAETLLERVQRTKILQVGTGSYPPMTYIDGETQTWKGFDLDFLGELARTIGAELFITYMPASALVPALQTGRIDVWVDLYKTPARAEVLDFSDVWIYYFDNLWVNSENPAIASNTIEAMTGKRIATCRGCAEEAYVDRIPGVQKVLFDSIEECFREVSTGRADGAILPGIFGEYALKQNPSLKMKSAGPVPKELLGADELAVASYFAVAKGPESQSFLQEMNKLITQWRDSGKLKEVLATYGMNDPRYFPEQ